MSAQKNVLIRAHKRKLRVRSKLVSVASRPRVSVFRSLNHIYAQLIDDVTQTTIASFSSQQLKDFNGTKKEVARHVGRELGKRALGKSIKEVYFDRGSRRYHGRIQELAEGLREGGLLF